MKKTLKLFTAIGILLPILFSCRQPEPENEGPDLAGSDCDILSCVLTAADGTSVYGSLRADTLCFVYEQSLCLEGATMEFTLSEGAEIDPDPASVDDWTQPLEFTVTSANKKNQKFYTYKPEFKESPDQPEEDYLQKDVVLTTQEEVNTFGEKGYRRVWSIVISDSENNPITDLTPLNSIEEIDYNLTVQGYHGKEVVFNNLKKISTFDINVPGVEVIGMNQLTEINNLMIGMLNKLDGQPQSMLLDSLCKTDFTALKKIYGHFFLVFQNKHPEFNLEGFEQLQEVGGEIIFSYPSPDFKTFKNLTKVNNIQISGKRPSFEGLENLKEITGLLHLSYLRGVESKSLMPFAPTKIGSILIEGIQFNLNLDFASGLKELDSFQIHGAYPMTSLAGLESLETIHNTLYLSMTGITDLNPLSNLKTIGKTIDITSNFALTDFSGLKECLKTFEGTWNVSGNAANPTIDEILNN